MTNLYIFYGQDDFSIKEALARLKAGLDSGGMLESNTVFLEGSQVRPDELHAICDTVPFLSGVRLVIVSGLLSRFESDRPRRSGRAAARPGPYDSSDLGEWRAFVEYLPHMPSSTVLVLLDGALSAGNRFLRAVQGRAEVQEFRPLQGNALREWLVKRARRLGVSLTPDAVRLLSEAVGNNLWQLASELEKLALYAEGRAIREEDVRALVSATREANVFSLIDAVVAGHREEAFRLLRRLLQEGGTVPHILALLVRQYRHLILARELQEQRIPAPEIGRRLGIASEYALRKVMDQAARYPLPRLEAAYHRLLEADVAMKTGALDEELALELLIGDLCGVPAH